MNGITQTPIFFEAGTRTLAGVLTEPSAPNGLAVMQAWGAGVYPSSGRNRTRARLSRLVAEAGFLGFRFDYTGVGESEGDYCYPALSKPYSDDIVAAASWLIQQGATGVAVVGNCFGGWSALMAAPHIPRLTGVVVINSPVSRDHAAKAGGEKPFRWWVRGVRRINLSKLRSPTKRRIYASLVRARFKRNLPRKQDARYSNAISFLLDRGVPLLLLYGNDDFSDDLQAELTGGLGAKLSAKGSRARVIVVPERLGGHASIEAQDRMLAETVTWLRDTLLVSNGGA